MLTRFTLLNLGLVALPGATVRVPNVRKWL